MWSWYVQPHPPRIITNSLHLYRLSHSPIIIESVGCECWFCNFASPKKEGRISLSHCINRQMISTSRNFTVVHRLTTHVSSQLHPNRAAIDGWMHVSATPNINHTYLHHTCKIRRSLCKSLLELIVRSFSWEGFKWVQRSMLKSSFSWMYRFYFIWDNFTPFPVEGGN